MSMYVTAVYDHEYVHAATQLVNSLRSREGLTYLRPGVDEAALATSLQHYLMKFKEELHFTDRVLDGNVSTEERMNRSLLSLKGGNVSPGDGKGGHVSTGDGKGGSVSQGDGGGYAAPGDGGGNVARGSGVKADSAKKVTYEVSQKGFYEVQREKAEEASGQAAGAESWQAEEWHSESHAEGPAKKRRKHQPPPWRWCRQCGRQMYLNRHYWREVEGLKVKSWCVFCYMVVPGEPVT